MLRNFQMLSVLLMLSIFLITCEQTQDGEENGELELTQFYTEDINSAPRFLNLETGNYSTQDYDLSFQSGQMTYQVALNSTAGVLAFATDTISFDTDELPAVGYSPDSSGLIIGDTWMDESTYNPSDHSISSNSMIYFIRSTDYRWVKFRVLQASPSAFTIEYAEFAEGSGFGDIQSKTIAYSSSAPGLFSFKTGDVVEPSSWDMVFATTPEYSTELQTNFYMPTILFNGSAGVKVGIIDDMEAANITEVPADINWISDSSAEHPFGNGGSHPVLVYHPEPPYNHKVIVEEPTLIYIIDTPSGQYMLRFDDYSSGIVVYSYAAI
ncbi:MAG: hypothetical protein K9M49_03415 [Candidatus Marinimicrobia bacterium]|nr:hypothetical protein [Candidatus Neomarinimicrobiota bacterium]MCF7904183.1 hypothetical protein [Candidatus Neomarinimicrobiota bacterium]